MQTPIRANCASFYLLLHLNSAWWNFTFSKNTGKPRHWYIHSWYRNVVFGEWLGTLLIHRRAKCMFDHGLTIVSPWFDLLQVPNQPKTFSPLFFQFSSPTPLKTNYFDPLNMLNSSGNNFERNTVTVTLSYYSRGVASLFKITRGGKGGGASEMSRGADRNSKWRLSIDLCTKFHFIWGLKGVAGLLTGGVKPPAPLCLRFWALVEKISNNFCSK